MSDPRDISVFDADNHLYETDEALTKFLPDRYRGLIDYVDVHGRTKIVVRGQISEYIPNPTFEVVARPGAMEDYFRVGNPEGKSRREIFGDPMRSVPAFRNPADRIELMDEQGLDRTLMFPTLASLVEERLRDDPEAIHAVIHALNEWLYETWQFDYEGRIFTTPVITMPVVEKALEEIDWVVERGAKVVLIRPAPVPGFRGSRSFAFPEFDPVWEKIVENDLLVAMHASDSGYRRYLNDWLGADSEMLPFQPQPFAYIQGWRAVEDACSALVCHGALARFPDLKLAFIENGAAWVEPLLGRFADTYKKMPDQFPEDPVAAFKRQIHISPFWEDDLGALADLVGVDRVLFGSDYPHPEGLADPMSYLDDVKHLDEESIRKIMGGNLARLMNLDVPAPA